MAELNVGKCKEHQRNYEGFCKICNVVICPSCSMFGSHKKHDVLTLNKDQCLFVEKLIMGCLKVY